MSNFYKEQRAMFNELEKYLRSGAKINKNLLILEITKRYAVSEKAINRRIDRYEAAGMVERHNGTVEWVADGRV